jgi:hypothetical protein
LSHVIDVQTFEGRTPPAQIEHLAHERGLRRDACATTELRDVLRHFSIDPGANVADNGWDYLDEQVCRQLLAQRQDQQFGRQLCRGLPTLPRKSGPATSASSTSPLLQHLHAAALPPLVADQHQSWLTLLFCSIPLF